MVVTRRRIPSDRVVVATVLSLLVLSLPLLAGLEDMLYWSGGGDSGYCVRIVVGVL